MIFILNAAGENCKSPFDVSRNLVGFRFIKRPAENANDAQKRDDVMSGMTPPNALASNFSRESAKHEHWRVEIDLPTA